LAPPELESVSSDPHRGLAVVTERQVQRLSDVRALHELLLIPKCIFEKIPQVIDVHIRETHLLGPLIKHLFVGGVQLQL
jgi:hypothetical protein